MSCPGELEEARNQTNSWSNKRRNNRGDPQLVYESGPNRGRDFWKEEKESSKDDTKKSRTGHGRIEWIAVIVMVQTLMLQAISEWESFAVRKRDGTVTRYVRACDFESVELERGWTVRGFDRHFSVTNFSAHRFGYFCCCRNVSKIG